MSVVFDSDDLERTEEFLSESYAPMRIGSGGRDAGAHITRVASDSVSADQLDLHFEMSYDVSPLGRICLCDIETGTIEDHQAAGWPHPADFGPGDLFSFAPPDRPYSGRICRARYSITMLDPDVLARVAGVEKPVELLDHKPVSAAVAQHLRGAITYVRDQVLAAPNIAEHPLLVSTAPLLCSRLSPRLRWTNVPAVLSTRIRKRCVARWRSSRPILSEISRPLNWRRQPASRRGRCSWRFDGTLRRRRWPICGGCVLTMLGLS